jgi:multicomponent Na+:H+ antiporter subunit E
LRPRLDLRPVELVLPLRLAPGPGQLLLAATLSLMPGTLAISIESNRLHLHVLDERLPAEHEVRAAEQRIARMLEERLG